MARFDLKSFTSALSEPKNVNSGVDFSGKSIKLDTESDAQPITEAINNCPELHHLTLTGNTLGVEAAKAIAKALEKHPELKLARWSDMFTGRMKTEIPPALAALGDGMIVAGTRLTVLELSDNAFGPIGVEGLAKLLQSEVCSLLQELRLNNNGLGITGGRLLSAALSDKPPRLRVFIAGRNRLENDGAKALAAVFTKMGSLQELAMPQNGIYHVGVSALSKALASNPGLRSLNLNDNTVGPKGAVAIAGVLPKLKKLKEINFGDCLLKSKGGFTLAKAFKENSVQLESVDLSHNEMGREACMSLVQTIADFSKGGTLKRLVLAGNSLGGPGKKEEMKRKLGAAAELSDGEASDEEYVTGSESESADDTESSSDEEGSKSGSGGEAEERDATGTLQDTVLCLDTSGVEEVESDVERFLQQPSLHHLQQLGDAAVDVIDAHLQAIKDPASLIKAYVEATLKISGLSNDQNARSKALLMYPVLFKRAGEKHAQQWVLANNMLVGLGLLKSENKQQKITWDLPNCFSVLTEVFEAPYFPTSLRETIRFFIYSKKDELKL